MPRSNNACPVAITNGSTVVVRNTNSSFPSVSTHIDMNYFNRRIFAHVEINNETSYISDHDYNVIKIAEMAIFYYGGRERVNVYRLKYFNNI